MNKTTLIKLFLKLQKQQEKGISLTELLVALVISGIVLTAATSGFVNILRANQDVESKTVKSATLSRALAFMQEDVKASSSVTILAQGTNCTAPTTASNGSANCLLLEFPVSYNTTLSASCTSTTIKPRVSYKYEDISSLTSQVFLKPGVLTRRIICNNSSGTAVTFSPAEEVIADGLVGVGSTQLQATVSCTGLTATGPHGRNSSGRGGFAFCLNGATASNRLVRIFLSGYVGKNVPPLTLETVTFARAQ